MTERHHDSYLRIDLSPQAIREMFEGDDDDPTADLSDDDLRSLAENFLYSDVIWQDIRNFVRDAQ